MDRTVTQSARPTDALRRRPDAQRTCLSVGPTPFTPPHQTRQNNPVCVVYGVAVWIGQLLLACSDFKFSVGDSLVDNPIHIAEADTILTGLFCRVGSGGVNWVWVQTTIHAKKATNTKKVRVVHEVTLCVWIFADTEAESWYAAFERETNSPNVVNVNVADGKFT